MTDLRARLHRGPDPRAELIKKVERYFTRPGSYGDPNPGDSLLAQCRDALKTESPTPPAPIMSYDLLNISPDDVRLILGTWAPIGHRDGAYNQAMDRIAAALRAAQETP